MAVVFEMSKREDGLGRPSYKGKEAIVSEPLPVKAAPPQGAKEQAMFWLLGQPAIVILLTAVVCGGFYIANKVVPMHFEKLKEVVTEQERTHTKERETESAANRDERAQWREFHKEAINQVERLATGRKTSGIASPKMDQ